MSKKKPRFYCFSAKKRNSKKGEINSKEKLKIPRTISKTATIMNGIINIKNERVRVVIDTNWLLNHALVRNSKVFCYLTKGDKTRQGCFETLFKEFEIDGTSWLILVQYLLTGDIPSTQHLTWLLRLSTKIGLYDVVVNINQKINPIAIAVSTKQKETQTEVRRPSGWWCCLFRLFKKVN